MVLSGALDAAQGGRRKEKLESENCFRLEGDLQANRFFVTKSERLIQKKSSCANIVFIKYN